MANKCDICLRPGPNLTAITDLDDRKKPIMEKFQKIAPEIEWFQYYKVCPFCCDTVDQVYEFRELCVSLDEERRQSQKQPPIGVAQTFTCYHCSHRFSDKKTLISHMQKHTKTREQPENLEQEKPKQGLKRRLQCETCEESLPNVKTLIQHCVKAHEMDSKSVKPFACDIPECPQKFTSSTSLAQHKKYHSGSRTHICSICGKTYITKNDLTTHEYTHFNRRNYKCGSCDKAFNTNKNLRSHILVVHTAPHLWKHQCTKCTKKFPLKCGLDEHLRRHAGDKRFPCHVCEKLFVSRSEMKRHLGCHSMAKPFTCPHCERGYRERKFYDLHLAKVHNVGELAKGCLEGPQALERHQCSHTGEKPHACEFCTKK